MSSKKTPVIGMRLSTIKFQRFTLLFVLVAWGLSFIGQINYDSWLRFTPTKIAGVDYNVYIEPQPLSPPLAKAVSFGATEFMADYYWLTMIQYYGGGTPNGSYRKLAELFNVVTDLSPKFVQAYQTGLVILPGEGFSNEAIALGEKGKKNLPDSWEVPYYTGLVHHIYKKDYVAAAKEFEIAATKKDALPITQYFAGIYYKAADQREIAYQIFKTVHDTTKDDFVRERSGKQMLHLEMAFFLQDAVAKYHTQFGRYPASPTDLVTKKIIAEVPTSPLDIKFVIDPTTGVVKDSK